MKKKSKNSPARLPATHDVDPAHTSQSQRCTCPRLAERTALGLTPWENLLLDLVRLECTVIATGDERATHAARELAVGRLGADGATTMLDGIAFLMQAIRSDRAGPFGFLPPCCAVVSPDERDLVAFIRACRFSNIAIIESRAMQLAQGLEGERLIVAGRALAAASRAPGHCDRTAQQDAFWDVSAPSPRVLH